jgi:isopenicillin-N N-acyltransferase-like protein
MVRRFVGLLVSAVLTAVFVPSVYADPPFHFPEAQCPHGALQYINGVPVLTIDGTPEEIGTAAGLLAVKPGRRMTCYPDDILHEFYLTMFRNPLLKVGRQMVKRFPADYGRELEAMVLAADIDRDLAVLGNTMFDLKKFVACSALLVEPGRSATGGTLMGRNLEYPSLGYVHEYTLVTVYRPKDAKHTFACVGFPGLLGCLSGMNDAGLAVAVLEVPQVKLGEKRFDSCGLPYALCYRRLLEECSTIAEAHAMLSQMKRTGLSNLAVADREGVAVLEITPERVVLRQGPGGTCVATNHFCSNELKTALAINFFSTFDRFETLTKVGELHRQLGPSDLHVGLNAAQNKTMTIQSMIFESLPLRLHVAFGTIPASAGEMKVVELTPLLCRP